MLMTALCTLGLVLMAACKNVETYAAAQVRAILCYLIYGLTY